MNTTDPPDPELTRLDFIRALEHKLYHDDNAQWTQSMARHEAEMQWEDEQKALQRNPKDHLTIT